MTGHDRLQPGRGARVPYVLARCRERGSVAWIGRRWASGSSLGRPAVGGPPPRVGCVKPRPCWSTTLLDEEVFAAATSELEPFIGVAITLERHAEAIVNAVIVGVNNACPEAMNSTVRLISHRA